MFQSTKESQRNQIIQKYKFIKHFRASNKIEDQSSPEYSPLRQEKSFESEKNAQVQTKYYHVYHIKKQNRSC